MFFLKKVEPFDLSEKKVVDEIKNYLCEEMPAYKKNKDYYISRTEDGYSYRFSFMVYNYYKEYDFDPYVYIRNEQIEQIEQIATKKETNKEITTIGNKISDLEKYDFIPGKSTTTRFSVNSWKSLEKTKTIFLKLLKKMEIGYFDKFSSLEMIHLALNKYPANYSVHRSLDVYGRYRRGVIVAKLVNASNYNELVDIYRQNILKNKPDELTSFELCVEYMNLNY